MTTDTAAQGPPAAAGLYHEAFEPGNDARLDADAETAVSRAGAQH